MVHKIHSNCLRTRVGWQYSRAFVVCLAAMGIPVICGLQQSTGQDDSNTLNQDNLSSIKPSSTSTDCMGAPIPNIIHYTWLPEEDDYWKKPLEKTAKLSLSSSVHGFLSVYAARHYHPDARIVIHFSTPSQPKDLCSQYTCDKWLKATLALGVEVEYLHALRRTSKGTGVISGAHRSDFMKVEALLKHGGIYQDFDSFMVRSFEPLRSAGFCNVLGLVGDWPKNSAKWPGNGLMMSMPNSTMMRALRAEMHNHFHGEVHDNSKILNRVAGRRSAIPGDILLMPQQAFFPYSWEGRTMEQYMCQGAQAVDLRLSYAFHLYDSMTYLANKEAQDMFWGMTVKKLLERDCNFCRLMRPHLQAAIKNGLIKEDW